MILLFSNHVEVNMGGVEIFNSDFQKLLKERNIEFHCCRSKQKNLLINTVSRLFKSIIFIHKNRHSHIIIQHANFYDLLSGLFIAIFTFKRPSLICHAGESWKHFRIRPLRWFSKVIFSLFIEQVFYLGDKQKPFIPKSAKKISTIINKKFKEIEKSDLSNEILNKYPILKEKYILFIGRVTKDKGILDICSIIAKKSSSKNNLVIVGPYTSAFYKQIQNEYGEYLNKRIFLIGPIYSIREKINIIDNCEFMIYVSYADAFPLTVIESYSRGKAILSSNISENINFVKDKTFLVDPGNIQEIESNLCILENNLIDYSDFLEDMKKRSCAYIDGQIIEDIGIK